MLEYDARRSLLLVILQYRSTIVQATVGRPEFGVLLLFHFTIVALRNNGQIPEQGAQDKGDEFEWAMPWGLVGIASGLTAFTLVFYTNDNFKRYNEMYECTKRIFFGVQELTTEIKVRLMMDDEDQVKKRHGRCAVRLLMGCVFCFFFEQNDNETCKAKLNEMRYHKLLQPAEYDFLVVYKEARAFLLLIWFLEVVKRALGPKGEKDLKQFTKKAFKLRELQLNIADILDLPLPFQYFHMMNLMLFATLVLWAYGFAIFPSYLASLIYFFVLMLFLGFRELARAFSNPFGDDDVDFPISEWLNQYLLEVHYFLEAQHDSFLVKPYAEQAKLERSLFDVVPGLADADIGFYLEEVADLDEEDEAGEMERHESFGELATFKRTRSNLGRQGSMGVSRQGSQISMDSEPQQKLTEEQQKAHPLRGMRVEPSRNLRANSGSVGQGSQGSREALSEG